MASHYWIKLYHEILDDPKMGRLRDNLWRRVIECFLMAGEMQADGYLPSLEDMAWRLHSNEEMLEAELSELARVGILEQRDGGWFVVNFEDRQSAMSAAERAKRWRERQRKQDYYGEETEPEPTANENRTNRSQNKKRIEKEPEEDAPATSYNRFLLPHLQGPSFLNTWGEWLEYQSELHNGDPPEATVKRQAADLGKHDEDTAIAMLEQSMRHGWKGVFPLKDRDNGDGPGEDAWEIVKEAIKKSDHTLITAHDDILEAVNNSGRWPYYKDYNPQYHSKLKREFLEAYHGQ